VKGNGSFKWYLETWCLGVAVILSVNAQPNTLTLYFWRIYEMGFPEDPQAIGSKGTLNILWSLFLFIDCFLIITVYWGQKFARSRRRVWKIS
jgi:hypothetical protein